MHKRLGNVAEAPSLQKVDCRLLFPRLLPHGSWRLESLGFRLRKQRAEICRKPPFATNDDRPVQDENPAMSWRKSRHVMA